MFNRKEYLKIWREKNKEKLNFKHRNYYKNNKDICKNSVKKWAKKNTEKIKKYALINYIKNKIKILERYKEDNKKRRKIVLEYYGGKCVCCSESIYEFLSIDHINGGGNKHRNEIFGTKKGGNIYHWLIKNNFPKGFQILCHNCNMAKGFYGKCPHKMV